MKFYDLRKRLCEEKEIGGDLAEMNQSVPGEDSVQCTAFNRTLDQPASCSPELKVTLPKPDENVSTCASPTSATLENSLDSDSDSGDYSSSAEVSGSRAVLQPPCAAQRTTAHHRKTLFVELVQVFIFESW